MKLTKLIYLASPYTYKHQNKTIRQKIESDRFNEVSKAIGVLQDKYPYAFIGPITQSHITAKYMKTCHTEFKAWKKRDLTYISRCDELWVLIIKGWDSSVGVFQELEAAQEWNIPIRFINPRTYAVKKILRARIS